MEELIQAVYTAVLNGDAKETKQFVQTALENGTSAEHLLYQGLITAMKEVGRLFEEGEYYVPEMLISARAMQSGMTILRPILVAQDIKPLGKVVIGTVEGDLHDIGKNLVSMMLEGAGFQMIDLGTNVAPEKFLDAITQHNPDILGMSALLTTTMGSMRKTLTYLVDQGIRDSIKIIVGGAPVTQKFADEIGADGFGPDASQAAVIAKSLMGED
jgi:5-methyltetrahydrofolate--homocysteine methyltransferase